MHGRRVVPDDRRCIDYTAEGRTGGGAPHAAAGRRDIDLQWRHRIDPLAAAVLGSRRALDLAWVALAAVGVWLLAGARLEADDLLGIVFAASAGVCWFAYILVGGRVARDWPDGRGAGAAMAVSALLIIPVAALLGDPGAIAASPWILVAGLAIGLFSSAVPYTFELAALGRERGVHVIDARMAPTPRSRVRISTPTRSAYAARAASNHFK